MSAASYIAPFALLLGLAACGEPDPDDAYFPVYDVTCIFNGETIKHEGVRAHVNKGGGTVIDHLSFSGSAWPVAVYSSKVPCQVLRRPQS